MNKSILEYKKNKEFFEIMELVKRKRIEIQTFDDNRQRHSPELANNFGHSPGKIQEYINLGAGAYWPINRQKSPSKRGYEFTIEFSALGLDLDGGKEQDRPNPKHILIWKDKTFKQLRHLDFPPAFVIESKNGLQPVWLFEPMIIDDKNRMEFIEEYKQLCKSMGIKFGLTSEGDNISRVLRLPNSFHLKTLSDPFEIKYHAGTGRLTDYKSFKGYVWVEAKPVIPTTYKWDGWTHDSSSIYSYPIAEALLKVSGTELVNWEEFDFTQERSGKMNIVIDQRASGQWIDIEHNSIGAPPGGEASVNIVNWCKWYHPEMSDKTIREALDKLLDGKKGRKQYSSSRVYALQHEKIEMSLSELENILSTTIKNDTGNKVITFLCYLLAYTENCQFNISYNAPSSSGKSYIALEVSKLFPKEDLLKLSYVSPTAFYHDVGTFDEEKDAHIVNLERKILIFIDMPHTMLLEKLRSLLSHDEKEITAKITDRNQRGQNRAKTVILRGFPSVVFASANFAMDEQEQTRFLLLSPETSSEKAEKALEEALKKASNEEKYKDELMHQVQRNQLIERIKDIKASITQIVIIHNPEKLLKMFRERYPKAKSRHSRDIKRLISLIQGWALLNLGQRNYSDGRITTNDTDFEVGFKLWDQISVAQDYGISPYLLNFYKEVIWPLYVAKLNTALERKEIQNKFYETYQKTLSYKQLSSEFLPMLEVAGLLIQEPDKDNKRKLLATPMIDLSKLSYVVHTPTGNYIPEVKTSPIAPLKQEGVAENMENSLEEETEFPF